MTEIMVSFAKLCFEAWRPKEPITRLQNWLESSGMIHAEDLQAIEASIAAEIATAVGFAEAGTWEPLEHLTRFVHSERAM